MIDFEEQISSILAADTNDLYERDPETFFAAHIGFCPRQLYVNKLGLSKSKTYWGKYRASRLIQNYFEQQFSDRNPTLETEVSVNIDEGPVRFLGRCTLYDPADEIAYVLKVRNGWYKFSPPIDRHLDQLHIYMQGLGVEQGKLVYVSKNDLSDIREWPCPDADSSAIQFDESRYEQLVTKAKRIRNQIWMHGIATSEAEIPLEKCGCYFCQEESLAFPDAVRPMSDGSGEPTLDTSENGGCMAEETVETGVADSTDQTSSTEAETRDLLDVPDSNDTRILDVDRYHIPAALRDLDIWVVWDGRSKVALAPWQADTMYPCEWAASKDVNPRRGFQKAKMVADLPLREIHRAWPFPDGEDLPEAVHPAVLLPHDPPDPPLSFVDFDDVRDPETGEVSDEVATLVDALDGYTEVSQSGTGLHVYVRGRLPEGVGAFATALSQRGALEIYDHARFTGGTWRHVAGTPLDSVPEATDVLAAIVSRY